MKKLSSVWATSVARAGTSLMEHPSCLRRSYIGPLLYSATILPILAV